MIKAVFFDIDGTLMSSSSKALPSTVKALAEAKKNGVLSGIATGRGPFHLDEQIDHLQLDVYITYNGQYVYTNDGEILYENPFQPETVAKLAAFCDAENRDMLFGNKDRLDGSSLMMLGQKAWSRKLYKYLPKSISLAGIKQAFRKIYHPKNKNRYASMSILKEEVFQCVLLSPRSETPRLQKMFPECHFARSNDYTVDIIPKGSTKIQGIEKVIQKHGILMEEVMAFGDSWNDTEMLSEVGTGIAMGNANADIKALADEVTDTNDRDGIYKALVKHKVIKGD